MFKDDRYFQEELKQNEEKIYSFDFNFEIPLEKKAKQKNYQRKNDVDCLPKMKYINQSLSNNDYLKLYKGANAVHDIDREKASSIVNNLVQSNKLHNNPYFNREYVITEEADLTKEELFNLGQLSEKEFKVLANNQNWQRFFLIPRPISYI